MTTYREINHTLREIRMKTRGKMVAEVTRQKVEFSPLEHKAMSDIREFEGASQQMLVESMNRDKAQIARIVARLHRQDLIIKQASVSDKRSVELTLSEKGTTLLERLDDVEMGMINEMLTGFSDDESETLRVLLKRVNNNLAY
ncbi:transcriptional regulator [Vibrio sp. 10N.286.49.C2]|uniref:MarR family winged helix-turn-helix transcriptional regulator n=1 Tax=unclassified Vibrio TaxID=2614977 RepID=UPI000C846906|nr:MULTISPECIES: MarR family transcriptional regulator [unclassified Vibrio]PMH36727.1 transcriptional regulator [Vibrio sp. 10N.286.49.C2]PMH54715.1 transcriptional regulator [Vibrio sp. 10N.286.49.B1]PMH80965.1 transcriptional regulator [Vibrio sp. 10N.286.48.B7]